MSHCLCAPLKSAAFTVDNILQPQTHLMLQGPTSGLYRISLCFSSSVFFNALGVTQLPTSVSQKPRSVKFPNTKPSTNKRPRTGRYSSSLVLLDRQFWPASCRPIRGPGRLAFPLLTPATSVMHLLLAVSPSLPQSSCSLFPASWLQ